MSRSIVYCVFLGFAAVVTAIPTVPNRFATALLIDVNPNLQNALQGWKDIIGFGYNTDKNNSSDVTDLFTASQLTVVPSIEVGDLRRYVIGKRVSNDRLVGHGADGKRWPTPQDVTLGLKYPTSGTGAIVTYVEIDVNQSSVSGKAYVMSGGIGQRAITIIVESKNTLWFSYTASIYGL